MTAVVTKFPRVAMVWRTMMLKLDAFGKAVRKARGDMGVRSAAKEVGVSHATFSRVENGKEPDLETFARICRWLRRDPRYFLGLGRIEPVKPRGDR